METYKFLDDIEELKFWWMYGMRPLKQNEVYFISTSARNKKLNEAEREIYNVGRSEMFHKEIISENDFSRFLKAIRKCESNKLAYLTKNGLPYPDKVLVLYCNISPSDAYVAMKEQINYLINTQLQLTDSFIKNSQKGIEDNFKNIRHCHTTGQSVFARSFAESEWVDVDCDIEGFKNIQGYEAIDCVDDFLNLFVRKGNFIKIETSGGFHYLIRKSSLSEIGRSQKQDPMAFLIDNMKFRLDGNVKINEIIRNKNEMVPTPGCLQYGNPVIIWNKDDFKDVVPFHEYPNYIDELKI
jgi:hypothetical protein